MKNAKSIIFGLVVVVIVGLIFYLQSQKPQRTANQKEVGVEIKPSIASVNKEEKAKQYPVAKEITTPDGFINTPSTSSGQAPSISVGEFVGKKVVLVDFWTYSCINCQRTIPYLNAWYEKYKDKGLVIIGVHTPEFEFEKKYENVLAAVKKFNIKYPVVLDNDFSTWNAYGNRYWPRKYLVDIDGFIVYDHIGEGAYEETEKKIQELLGERAAVLGEQEKISKDIANPKGVGAVDFSKPRSPEIYFGASRNLSLGNGKPGTAGLQTLTKPAEIKTNILYLIGVWEFNNEFAENRSSQAKIILRYQAKGVYFVASAKNGVKMRIFRDGQPLTRAAGEDVVKKDGEAVVTIKDDQLYKLIEDSEYGKHTLEIIIENPGLRAFTFTFG